MALPCLAPPCYTVGPGERIKQRKKKKRGGKRERNKNPHISPLIQISVLSKLLGGFILFYFFFIFKRFPPHPPSRFTEWSSEDLRESEERLFWFGFVVTVDGFRSFLFSFPFFFFSPKVVVWDVKNILTNNHGAVCRKGTIVRHGPKAWISDVHFASV